MKSMYLNIHPTRLFGPTRLIGTWEYLIKQEIQNFIKLRYYEKATKFYKIFTLLSGAN